MRTAVTVAAAFCMLTFSPLLECQDQDQPPDALFSPDQLDNLLAKVAGAITSTTRRSLLRAWRAGSSDSVHPVPEARAY